MKLLLENWRKYLTEDKSQQATAYLDDMLGKSRASGRQMPAGFDKITEDNAQVTPVAIVNELTPSYLRTFMEKHSNVEGPITSIDVSKVTDPREIAVINSILLFTAGNVAAVRSPEEYSDDMGDTLASPVLSAVQGQRYGYAKYVDSRLGPEDVLDPSQVYKDRVKSGTMVPQYLLKPSKELYTIANYVMSQLGVLKNINNPEVIYRGMGLPVEVIDNLTEGAIFNNRSVSSWTASKDMAQAFDRLPMGTGEYVQFIIESPSIGTDISNLSAFPQEKEFILGTQVRITNVRKKDRTSMGMGIWTYITCEIV